MNQLIAMSGEMTMTSLEFMEIINAERVAAGESEHEPRKFLAKVQDELDLDDTGKKFRLNANHTESAYYDLTIDQMMLVGMRESKSVRRNVLDKLKSMQKPQIPQTYAAALLEAGRLALELEQSQQQLALAAPKADVFDKVIERENLLNATQVAQQVGMSAVKMNKQLDVIGGVYSKSVKRGRTFCHGWVESGYGEMKIGESGYPQALFTTKGSLRVVELFISEGVI